MDADAFVRYEREQFDLAAWLDSHEDLSLAFTSTVWHQLYYGDFAWESARAQKRLNRLRFLSIPVISFNRKHAERAALIDSQLKNNRIGFADCEIAAVVIEEGELLLVPLRNGRIWGKPSMAVTWQKPAGQRKCGKPLFAREPTWG